jgi:hypothetical protein
MVFIPPFLRLILWKHPLDLRKRSVDAWFRPLDFAGFVTASVSIVTQIGAYPTQLGAKIR